MRKLYAIILFLLSVSFPALERPWQNISWVSGNPNIWNFGSELWWNVEGFQESLDSFGPQMQPNLADSETKERLEDGWQAAEKARSLQSLCVLRMLGSLGTFPVNPGQSFIGLFSKASECTGFRESWKSSVDYFLDAAELSLDASEASVSDAGDAYDRLVFSGLCESDYSGPVSEGCSEIKSSLLSASIKEGNYGKYALALEKSTELESGLRRHIPDLSAARTIIGLAWGEGGIVDSFEGIRSKAESMEKDASAEFIYHHSSALAGKASAQEMLGRLERKGLAAIKRAPSGSTEAGAVSKRLSGYYEALAETSALISRSKLDFGSSGYPGYLAKSLSGAALADERMGELSAGLLQLDGDAERAVSEQEEETLAELEAARAFVRAQGGSESLSYLERAEAALGRSERAASLGERFKLLSESAAFARSAATMTAREEIADSSAISSLKDLIRRAELDGINVAPEKDALPAIESLPAPVASAKAGEFTESIIQRSRAAYGADLEEQRKRIMEKLSLAGPDAADLESDLNRMEKGHVSGNSIVFPDAIGSLAKLSSDYGSLERELDEYMLEIVGNSMSAQGDPIILEAKLDEPSEILLELSLANPTPYQARGAQVKILLARPVPFMLSEIKSGKDGVESIRMSEGNSLMSITLSEVVPYGTKRISFSKRQTLARKTGDLLSAVGLGGGSARVYREIQFELDTDVRSISFPDGIHNPVIDGQKGRGPLGAGKHSVVSEEIVEDAYQESIGNVRAYKIGLNSKVEFDIAIEPSFDLSSVPIFVDSLNDSAIRSFELVSVSGETLRNKRRISDTQVAAELAGLKGGRRAVVRISYLVENTGEFVLKQLDVLGALNMSSDAGALLAKARGEAASGNYSEALELIENAKAAQKEDEARERKNAEKFRSLLGDARAQAETLDLLISRSNLNGTFVQKLSARKSEVEKALQISNESYFSTLEDLDEKWLGREIGSLRKEIYKDYGDLKERFYLAGNYTTPPEFLAFEKSLISLESGENPEYAIDALEDLGRVSSLVEQQEKNFQAERESMVAVMEKAKSSLLSSWDAYSRQASAAKGTDFSGMFSETERGLNSLIKEAESSIDEPRALHDALEKMGAMEAKLDLTLASLKESALARISLIEETPETSPRIAELRGLVDKGDYVNALRGAAILSKESEKETGNDPGLPIIGITALAVLGAAGFYVMKPKKELRKLNSWKAPMDTEKKLNPAKLSS